MAPPPQPQKPKEEPGHKPGHGAPEPHKPEPQPVHKPGNFFFVDNFAKKMFLEI